MSTPKNRTSDFQRNLPLEELLQEINKTLGPAEQTLALPEQPALPVLLVVGPPRSGTTLMMQWLAATGAVAWPSNLLSRFYAAPYLGMRIQQLLTDPRFNYRDELVCGAGISEFASELGKTRGLLQPNEYWYFWRRFFPVAWPQPLTEEQLAKVDRAGFVRGLAAIESACGKPVSLKALLLQYNIALLSDLLPNAIFVYLERDPIANAQSLLEARRRFWGDDSQWYSAQPPGTEMLLGRSAHEQVAGQILFTHRSIQRELSALPDNRKIAISYESFCQSTEPFWVDLRNRLRMSGAGVPADHSAPGSFDASPSRIGTEQRRAWEAAYSVVSSL